MSRQVVRRKKVDTGPERQILIGMITNDVFLAEITPMLDPEYFLSDFSKTVARWCTEHFQEFSKAPGVHIQDIFESQRRNGLNEDTADLIGEFLESISNEYERAGQFNADYMLKEAERTFKARAMSMMAEDVQALISQGKYQDAELLLAGFAVPERKGNDWIDPLSDDEALERAFEESNTTGLFKMPGALGDLMGPFERDMFISLMGPEKRGKTWWMTDIAMRGLRARCNTAFFQIGDLTMKQMQMRMYSWLCQASRRAAGRQILMPVLDCQRNQLASCERSEWLGQSAEVGTFAKGKDKSKGEFKVHAYGPEYEDHVPCIACMKMRDSDFIGSYWWRPHTVPALAQAPTLEKAKEFMKRVGDSRLRLCCQPSDTVSAEWIDKQLELWYRKDGWVPDLVIVDYADNLAPVNRKKEERHAINQTWQWLRKISQVRNCCLVTATQAGRGSYTKAMVGAEDTSEDKRKLAHVNAMYALNQTPEEKKHGIMRISNILVREDDFDIRRNATVLQCISIGRPYLASF